MDEISQPDLEELWKTVEEHWDDKAAHDSFLTACHGVGALGVAAAKYRSVIGGPHEDRRAVAQKRITAVALLATQALEASREAPPRTIPRWMTVAAVVMATSAVGWLIWALMK